MLFKSTFELEVVSDYISEENPEEHTQDYQTV